LKVEWRGREMQEREREADWNNKAGEEDVVAYLRAVCFKAGPLMVDW